MPKENGGTLKRYREERWCGGGCGGNIESRVFEADKPPKDAKEVSSSTPLHDWVREE